MLISRNERILFEQHVIAFPSVPRSEYDVAMKSITPEQYKTWELEDCTLQAQLDNVR